MKLPWLTQREQFSVGGLVVFALAFAILTLLYGCASAPMHSWDWEKKYESIAERPTVYSADVEKICAGLSKTQAGGPGCAVRDAPLQKCYIFLPLKPAQWLIDHENKHCDGWVHTI